MTSETENASGDGRDPEMVKRSQAYLARLTADPEQYAHFTEMLALLGREGHSGAQAGLKALEAGKVPEAAARLCCLCQAEAQHHGMLSRIENRLYQRLLAGFVNAVATMPGSIDTAVQVAGYMLPI
jgi:hypothetical protein